MVWVKIVNTDLSELKKDGIQSRLFVCNNCSQIGCQQNAKNRSSIKENVKEGTNRHKILKIIIIKSNKHSQFLDNNCNKSKYSIEF